jgi:hypothetical protein
MMDEMLIRTIETRVSELEMSVDVLRFQKDQLAHENHLLKEIAAGMRAEIEMIRRDREYSP